MIKSKIEEAVNLVKNIPEDYRNITLGVVLAYLLLSEKDVTTTIQHKPQSMLKCNLMRSYMEENILTILP